MLLTVQLLAILCPLAFAVSQPKSCPLTRSYRALLLLMNFGGLTGNCSGLLLQMCSPFSGSRGCKIKVHLGPGLSLLAG